MCIKNKKTKDGTITSHKFPSINASAKLESSLKQSYLNDASTDEEGEKGGMLPQINNPAATLGDTKLFFNPLGLGPKRKEKAKKLSYPGVKANLTNQHSFKKPQNNIILEALDPLVVGKKAL